MLLHLQGHIDVRFVSFSHFTIRWDAYFIPSHVTDLSPVFSCKMFYQGISFLIQRIMKIVCMLSYQLLFICLLCWNIFRLSLWAAASVFYSVFLSWTANGSDTVSLQFGEMTIKLSIRLKWIPYSCLPNSKLCPRSSLRSKTVLGVHVGPDHFEI